LVGRGLTPDTVEDAVAAFLFDGERVRTELIPSILESLRRIISVIEDPSFPYRFYTSPLLFIYEGDKEATIGQPPRIELKIIDFAHAVPKSCKDGEGDDGFLFGLRNLVILFQNIAVRHDGGASSSSDEDSSSEEEADSSRWKLECARERREREFIRMDAIVPLILTSP